ncbi:MAG: hypothetical protein AAFP99_12210 [Pseudomonadota bacterium]
MQIPGWRFFLAGFVALAWMSNAQAADGIQTPAGFMAWQTPESKTVNSAMEILGDRWNGFPDLAKEGRPELTMNVRMINRYDADQARVIVDVTETGYADDSADGGWQRFMLKPLEDGRLSLVAHGVKWKCARGALADQWVAQACN